MSFRRECSWDPPPETTLQSFSWSSWTSPGKARDDEPTTVETTSAQEEAAGTTSASVEMATIGDERGGDVAPRDGASLGHGGAANTRRSRGNCAVVIPAAGEGGGAATSAAAAAGNEEAFFGDQGGSSDGFCCGEQQTTEVQVQQFLTETVC